MKLITIEQAAGILAMSPRLLRYRIERGDLPVARYRPTRLRVDRVLAYRASAVSRVSPRSGRPRKPDALTVLMTKARGLVDQAEQHADLMPWS